ncbi:hypothetical protein L861_05890, partial [Litchfieldella anticariensis FP35 = DSM 16096]
RLIDAARRGELTFELASDEKLNAFKRTLSTVLGKRQRLRSLNNRIRQAQAAHGHRSPPVRGLKRERTGLQSELGHYERLLAESLSPVDMTPAERTQLAAALGDASLTEARAGITLVLPAAAQQQEVSRLIRHFRQGISSTAKTLNVTGDGLSLAIFVAQAVNMVQAFQAYNSLPSHAPREVRTQARLNVASALTATGAAGFLTAQGIGQAVLERQAKVLGEALGTGTISARLGVMHATLGGVGYLLGFFAAGASLIGNVGNLTEAVRSGQSRTTLGAVTAMGGNVGMMGAHGYGVARTFRTVRDVRSGVTTWAVAGKHLGKLFLRLNALGLVFTALELAGSWMYNRYNLSEHDQWLLTSPWGAEPTDQPLERYLQFLEQVLQPTHAVVEARYGETFMPAWFDSWTEGIRNPVKYIFTLHMPNVSPAMLSALGGEPPLRLAIRVWRLTPAGTRGRWTSTTWHDITEDWTSGMVVTSAERHAGLMVVGETPPEEPGKVRYALGVRYQWPDGQGGHRVDDQYFLIRPRRGRGAGPEQRYVPNDRVTPSSRSGHGEWHEIDGRAIALGSPKDD